jgi:hypothetical protein
MLRTKAMETSRTMPAKSGRWSRNSERMSPRIASKEPWPLIKRRELEWTRSIKTTKLSRTMMIRVLPPSSTKMMTALTSTTRRQAKGKCQPLLGRSGTTINTRPGTRMLTPKKAILSNANGSNTDQLPQKLFHQGS